MSILFVSEFTVNGTNVKCTDKDKKLLDYLREDLRLTSVKDGNSKGVCGACTVLVDGTPTRSCLLTIEKMSGKQVITVEGLSSREKEVYAYSFAAAGAVQCGFCIPGIVINAKGLLDNNLTPSRNDVKKAINNNICRCTGYVKIEDAILMAAKFFRENLPIPQHEFTGKLGEDFFRVDAEEKTLGTGMYTNDMVVDGMVYAQALRTKYPRARVLAVNSTKAEKHPECIRIITAADVPGNNKCGHLIKDWDALIAVGDITRYVGDAIAVAVAETKEALAEILSLIDVEYEILTPLTSPKEALAEGAPKIHESGNVLSKQTLKRGNAEEALAKAKHVVTQHYSTPFTDHAFLETECAIAIPDGKDGLLLYTGAQSIYDDQKEVAWLLGLPPEKIRVKSMLVGGGFGGKEDMSVQHHAALAAWLVKRPVKIKMSRQESIQTGTKRHAMEIDFTTACDENGIITAVKAEIISDTGAYASLGGPVLQRSCTHAGGPYNFQNIEVNGIAVYTNNPPAGAFRGFGVPQSTFAMESNLNLLAEKVGISPWEIRYRNAIRPGQELPNGQIADDSTALEECLLAVKDIYEKASIAGLACGFKNAGLGVGVPDIGRCILSVENGKIHIRISSACIGQGMATVAVQMACETLNLPPGLMVVEPPDTARVPNSGTTTASRQTVFSGEAIVDAAKKLNNEISKLHACDNILAALEGREFYGEYKPETDPMGSDKPNPVSHVAYGYAVQVAELSPEGKLTKVTAAYDLGRVVNPKAAEGQIEGGIVMGIGYALTENYPVKDCYPTAKFGTLGLLRSTDIPEIDIIMVERKQENPAVAHGAKGVGELATIPTAPAIHGAYYKKDGKLRPKLPMNDTYYKV
ncbi:MAG: selenium-dependent xanthine dehydrogenase [Defluviitaleaceae bacterium]|nr:selenium-dependent xanthine dehydrogenase [Defluviitaleaceae bacterium]